MKYIREFTAQDILTNVNYWPHIIGSNPTMDKLKKEMIDLYRSYLYVNEFMYNYCSNQDVSESVKLELDKRFLRPFTKRVWNGDVDDLLSEYFVLKQLCAHSDGYELAIKPKLRSTTRLEIFGTIFNDVDTCNRMDALALTDYESFLNDMIEYGYDPIKILPELDRFKNTLKSVAKKPTYHSWGVTRY